MRTHFLAFFLKKGLMACGFVLYVFSLTIYADTASQKNNQPPTLTNAFSSTISAHSKLPVSHNRFVVDKDVSEIEVLISTDQFKSIQLISPDGKVIIPSEERADSSWQRIEKLYAIKVKSPAAGGWQIQGNLQSYPEVIVTSNLDMVTPLFPNNLIRGETLSLSTYLEEEGKKITQGDILSSTQITATLQNVATSELYKIYLSEGLKSGYKNSQGIYRYDYRLDNQPGVYTLDILAVGLLFQRERHQQFYLHDYPGTTTTTIDADNDLMIIKVHLTSPMLNFSTFNVSANLFNNDGSNQTVVLDNKDPQSWELSMPASQDINRLSVVLAGSLNDSRPVQIVFPEVKVEPLYNQAYLELEQDQLRKSNQEWMERRQVILEQLLPFSTEKQIETYIIDANLIEDSALKPLPRFPTYMQSLLADWEPKIFGNQEDEWMKSLGAEDKHPVLSPAQTKAKLFAEQKAIADAKKRQEVENLLKRKKVMLIVFMAFCMVFMATVGAVIWYLMGPYKRKAQAPLEEVKPETDPEVKPETVPEIKPETMPEIKPETVPEIKPETVPEIKPETVPEIKPEIVPEIKPETVPEIKPETVPEIKPETVPEIKPETVPEIKPETVPEIKPETVPEVKPETVPEIKPDDQPQAMPQTTINQSQAKDEQPPA